MPANMKKSGMSYKKGGSKKMYGGTMKKKMAYGGSNAKMPKSMYNKGGSKPDFLDLDKDGNTTEPMKSTYMYGGSMYKKMMKMAGGPMMNEQGMKVPGMMKAGGGLNKKPGGGFMRDMDLPKAQMGSFRRVLSKIKNVFKNKKSAVELRRENKINNTIDDIDVSKILFKGVNRTGDKTFKIGNRGNVFNQSNSVMPFSQTLKKKIRGL